MDASQIPAGLRSLDSLPGPKGIPVLGNALQIRPERFHQQLDAWAEQFGDKFRFRIASRQFLAVRDPEVIATVLRQRPETFRKGLRLVDVTRDLGFAGVFSANGEAWRRQRPIVLAGLDPAHIRTFLPAILGVTSRLRSKWFQAADEGRRVDLLADLMRYTVDVTTTLAFGRDLNTLETGDEHAIQQHLNHLLPTLFRRTLAPMDLSHWLDWKTRMHVRALRKAVDGFIADARRTLEQQPALRDRPANLIQALVVANQRGEASLSDEELSGNVLTLLLAGEDTTANTLAWMIWLLSDNPQALAQAQREADHVLGKDRMVMSIEQIGQLDQIEACANEAMRLKPVAPVNMTQAGEDTVVDGVQVPKGTMVACMMRPGGLRAQHFEAPERFDPQRWLGEGRHSISTAKRVVMPFGAGPRICPGRYLALAEIKIVAAMLLANFELAFVGTADGAPPQERLALTMAPVGLRMQLRRRERPAV